jgi:hypothetical protein
MSNATSSQRSREASPSESVARAQAKERDLEAARAKRLGTGKTKPKLPPGRAMLRGLEAFVRWRYRADGGRCVTDDGEMIMDVLLCFWASVARELGMQPSWARTWAWIIVPVLAAEHDDRWWLARERRALRRRKGCGWKPDDVARHWLIRERELIACFGEDHRRRCGLVSKCRPPEVRAADRKAKDKARKVGKGGRTPRAEYEAESASRLEPWKAFGIKRRAWERRGKPTPPEATTQVCPQHSPVRDKRTHLRRPRLTSAKEGLSSREAVSPVTGSPPPPEQTVERVGSKPEPRHNLGQKRRAGTTSARGKLAA